LVTPNPSSSEFSFEILPAMNELVEQLTLTDVSGRIVGTLKGEIGKYNYSWYPENSLPAGIYYVKVQTNSRVLTKKLVRN
jgi:hypothetical protein